VYDPCSYGHCDPPPTGNDPTVVPPTTITITIEYE
jgi:hypothetical protein